MKRKLELRCKELNEVVVSKYNKEMLMGIILATLFPIIILYVSFYFLFEDKWLEGTLVLFSYIVPVLFIPFIISLYPYKKIGITDKGIWTRRLLFPFITRYYDFEDFDNAYNIVEVINYRRGKKIYEAYWLTKEERLVVRIVSYMYSNYEDIKKAIKVNNPDFELEFEEFELYKRLLFKKEI